MKRLLLLFICALSVCAAANIASAATFPDETLHYTVTYKWGLIHKDAGKGTLTLRNSGNNYNITLTAHSLPWADRIFRVRDTLHSIVARDGFLPLSYTKAAHEDGKYSLDRISYSRCGNVTMADTYRLRTKKGKTGESTKQFSTSGAAYDMLSIFYWIRHLDFAGMRKGQTVKTTVFSGSQSETVTLTFLGTEELTLRNKKRASAYHVRFRFTTAGKKQSSDDMEAWLATDPSHKALRIVGKLPVGQVRVELDS